MAPDVVFCDELAEKFWCELANSYRVTDNWNFYVIEGPKIQSKKLGCFINKKILESENGTAYCKVASAILFRKKAPMYHWLKDEEGARAKLIKNMHCKSWACKYSKMLNNL